jgi:UDP-N-acetylglucosamine 2-epimerase (non-hydrolysing)
MAPLIKESSRRNNAIDFKVCITGQHKEMLYQVMDFFEIKADYDLELMKANQTLSDITSNVLLAVEDILKKFQPDILLVQGDTTTAMAAALAAFYQKISVGHVEAGLRSFDKYAPYPEEINRKIISSFADYHFTPTKTAAGHLNKENVSNNIYVTGNTVIDALLWGVEKVKDDAGITSYFKFIDFSKKVILVTAHRRESFGAPFEAICRSLLFIATKYTDVEIVYPVHLNPNVQEVVKKNLTGVNNIHLIAPLDYAKLIWLMNKSFMVITDSGGIQEEAPSLGKPVLVLRNVTERTEGVEAGTAKLVGTEEKNIINEAEILLNNPDEYKKMATSINPYGNGKSAERILSILINQDA